MARRGNRDPRLAQRHAQSLNHQQQTPPSNQPMEASRVALDMGWGDLILAHTFDGPGDVAHALLDEPAGRRNLAIYVRDPHVILAQNPQQLFLDPSHTFRLWLAHYRTPGQRNRGYIIRRLRTLEDAQAINRIYASHGMVPIDEGMAWKQRASRTIIYAIAEDLATGRVVGTATGVDHVEACGDPEGGSSLWCLAVDPDATLPGLGQSLVRFLAEHYQARGRVFMDLSVMHDNKQAIALYEKLGFVRVPVFTVKTKNAINEPLYTEPAEDDSGLNVYAAIITNEAGRRGIRVEILDAEAGYFKLTLGGRAITCRESLSALTSAIAMSRCADKRVTRRILHRAGLNVPAQRLADGSKDDVEFLRQHGSVVVKPADGEQGTGISVDIRDTRGLRTAIRNAAKHDENVLIEQFCPGDDLRIIVIGYKVVAAAVRRPPVITGDGVTPIRTLIEKLSRRREAATDGEARIPLDKETERCVKLAGHTMDGVLPEGETLAVRKTANLHTGGTLQDVTPILHPRLVQAAVSAARALEIPVTGLDLLVPAASDPDYVIIEANERPGLANHEPQPTAQRFIDFLFPRSAVA
ncbi:N-acetylglutaminylglutamine synthetase [Algiphilus sp.]|uniref:N-acetylglutaminylglutamine synthetase n=1 Tax=Algiphilus sp. TaxID=1872431 RepID=UPI003C412F63